MSKIWSLRTTKAKDNITALMFVVCLCLKIIFRRFTPNIRKGLICLNLGTYIHENALTSGGFAPWPPDQGLCPWTPLGALPPDPRYNLALRARHGLQPPPKVKFLVTSLELTEKAYIQRYQASVAGRFLFYVLQFRIRHIYIYHFGAFSVIATFGLIKRSYRYCIFKIASLFMWLNFFVGWPISLKFSKVMPWIIGYYTYTLRRLWVWETC